MLSVWILFPHAVSARPVKLAGVLSARQASTANQAPIAASSDVWATVIANVAPIMALVGERNAKEFLRVSSSHDQLFLMATAPLGILSLMICAIRLSGPRILRRLAGREADPKSQALVELTPLSVAPATAVYTQHAVEVKPNEQRDEVAFVCAHIKQTDQVYEALESFKHILRSKVHNVEVDSDGSAITDQEDYEIVLGIKRSSLNAEDTARLVSTLLDKKEEIEKSFADQVKSTSLSVRMTGISPTQTAPIDRNTSDRRSSQKLPNPANVLAGIWLFIAMAGIQVGGYYKDGYQLGSTGLKTLIMGLVGYCGIVVFTFLLLAVIKQEIEVKPQDLTPIFDMANVVWTFSDSRHAHHQAFDKPHRRNLVQAAPKNQQISQKRQVITSFVSAGLLASYVVYYLGVRVAVWWVPFGQLLTTWFSAFVRALTIKAFLEANDQKLGEHWLGIFRDDLSESLLETVATMKHNMASSNALSKSMVSSATSEKAVPSPSLTTSKPDSENSTFCSDDITEFDETVVKTDLVVSCTLVVAKPNRQSLQNWSGCEDIMKVALEMAKHLCQSQEFRNPGHALAIADVPSFERIIRFRLMVFVPGVLWKADTDLDYILTERLDLPNLYRDILKIFHLCGEVNGTIDKHEALTKETSAEVSHVLCGPLANVPDSTLASGCTMTLTELLVKLRNQNSPDHKAYTLEQSLLLPTIQLATMYESCSNDEENLVSRIQLVQNAYTDKLCLSGQKYLSTLEAIFEERKIWQHFMKPKLSPQPSKGLQPRDETSGLYGKPARRKRNESSWL